MSACGWSMEAIISCIPHYVGVPQWRQGGETPHTDPIDTSLDSTEIQSTPLASALHVWVPQFLCVQAHTSETWSSLRALSPSYTFSRVLCSAFGGETCGPSLAVTATTHASLM